MWRGGKAERGGYCVVCVRDPRWFTLGDSSDKGGGGTSEVKDILVPDSTGTAERRAGQGRGGGGGGGGYLGTMDIHLPGLRLEQLVGKVCHILRWAFPILAVVTMLIIWDARF